MQFYESFMIFEIFLKSMRLDGKWKGMGNLELETRVGGGHVVDELVAVFAHERLLVVATDVVPCDTVTVHVVQHAQARFLRTVDVKLGIVRLWDLLVAALAPRVVRPTDRRLVGGRHLAPGGRPEPPVYVFRFQVRTVLAAIEVAQPSAGPYIRCVVYTDNDKNRILYE